MKSIGLLIVLALVSQLYAFSKYYESFFVAITQL